MRVGRRTAVILSTAFVAGSLYSVRPVQAADPGAAEATAPDFSEKLTGDWGGARAVLAAHGIDVTLDYTGEVLGILSGGAERGASYEGRLDLTIDADLEKLLGWTGGSAQLRVFQLHDANNRNAASFTGSLADPSNIDALPTTRLFTFWVQQDFAGYGSLRVGQLAADDEFFTSDTAGGLINGTFGWATVFSANLPSGGPAYPLAVPGVRLELQPTDQLALLGGLFAGDPAGRGCEDDPQICNPHGTTFSFSGGALLLGEAQYLLNQDAEDALPAAYKLGVWHHTADFADQRYGRDAGGHAVSLASSDAVGPLLHQGNWGVYALADQTIWKGEDWTVSVFARGGFSPADRNLVSWYVDGGIGIGGLFAGRPDDTFTVGIAHSEISHVAAALDHDANQINSTGQPVRTGETVLELSYVAQITPWWSVQPDLQYIIRPGGNVADPSGASHAMRDAVVVGLRSTVSF